MGFASFLSTAFTIDSIANSPDEKLVNPISVQCDNYNHYMM